MATMKIKKGDLVKVIAGKDINNEGKVIAVNAKKNTLLVEGINKVTKHTKQVCQISRAVSFIRRLQLMLPT